MLASTSEASRIPQRPVIGRRRYRPSCHRDRAGSVRKRLREWRKREKDEATKKERKRERERGNGYCGRMMQHNSAPVTRGPILPRTESEQTKREQKGRRRRRRRESAWTRFIHEERADNSARSLLPIHYFAKRWSARRQGHRIVPPAPAIVPKYRCGLMSVRERLRAPIASRQWRDYAREYRHLTVKRDSIPCNQTKFPSQGDFVSVMSRETEHLWGHQNCILFFSFFFLALFHTTDFVF